MQATVIGEPGRGAHAPRRGGPRGTRGRRARHVCDRPRARRGDRAFRVATRTRLTTEAALAEEFGTSEGYLTVAVEAAAMWVAAVCARPGQVLLLQVVGGGLATVRRDVDWVLIVPDATEGGARTDNSTWPRGLRAARNLRPDAESPTPVPRLRRVVEGSSAKPRPRWPTHRGNRWRAARHHIAQRFGATWWVRRFSSSAPQRRPPSLVPRYCGRAATACGYRSRRGTVAVREMKASTTCESSAPTSVGISDSTVRLGRRAPGTRRR